MRDRELFAELIGPVEPRISAFPHLVLMDGPQSFWRAVAVARTTPGWWGNSPMFNADGSPYTGLDQVTALRIWGTAANQRWLHQQHRFAKLGHLTFLTRANLPSSVVSEIYQSLERDVGPDVGNLWPVIAARLGSIRWAYIPLSDECPLALFVVANNQTRQIMALEDKLRNNRVFFTKIVSRDGMDAWHIPSDRLAEIENA